MSRKFYAVNRITKERWKPANGVKEYLMMYDSGYLAVVKEDFYTYIVPLDPKIWETVVKVNILPKTKDSEQCY